MDLSPQSTWPTSRPIHPHGRRWKVADFSLLIFYFFRFVKLGFLPGIFHAPGQRSTVKAGFKNNVWKYLSDELNVFWSLSDWKEMPTMKNNANDVTFTVIVLLLSEGGLEWVPGGFSLFRNCLPFPGLDCVFSQICTYLYIWKYTVWSKVCARLSITLDVSLH